MLLERLRARKNTVLIIDEAQNLDAAALEEVRLLSNLETDTASYSSPPKPGARVIVLRTR